LRSGEYYSKGKLLLTGEYAVLYGAKALAVPLQFGQQMLVSEIKEQGIIMWETFVQDKLWFSASFRREDMNILNHSNERTALIVRKLLKEGAGLNHDLSSGEKGCLVRNNIGFNMEWGLGSSSSLLSNLAAWLDIDLYTYYQRVFQGSGYDVFSARANTPISYQLKAKKPEIIKTTLKTAITNKLYFIYLGFKKDSQESVQKFRAGIRPDPKIINEISALTDAMIDTSDANDFFEMMRLHEELLSGLLKQPKIKEERFADFKGEIKSLGAWGGDFIMAGTHISANELKQYFLNHNLPVIFKWDEIVIK